MGFREGGDEKTVILLKLSFIHCVTTCACLKSRVNYFVFVKIAIDCVYCEHCCVDYELLALCASFS